MRVMVRGTIYATELAAANAFGVTVTYINRMIDQGKEDSIGLGRGGNKYTPKPYTIEGLTFKSMREASIALGFRPNRIAEVRSTARQAALDKIIAAARAYKEKTE
jgi:hypothetical protein